MNWVRKMLASGTVTLAVAFFMTCLVTVAIGEKKGLTGNSKSAELADVERRISKLETDPPFLIIDKQDKPVFSIYSGYVRPSGVIANMATLYDAGGRASASMAAASDGGFFEAYSSDAQLSTYLQTGSETLARLSIFENGNKGHLFLGESEAEEGKAANYALKFPAQSGADKLIAGIGESKQQGSGVLIIGNAEGQRVASLSVGEGNKGMVTVFKGGNAIAALSEAVGNKSGSLVLGDASGAPTVKMGAKDDRYGVVLTFPLGLPYVPKSGLPGSYMLGCSGGGKVCVP